MGFNADEIYASQSDRLKAADLQKRKHVLSIKDVTLAEFTDKETGKEKRLLELGFNETNKTLLLNKTNTESISYIHGPDTDGWIGAEIILYPTRVSFGDKMVEAIRIEMPLEEARGGLGEQATIAARLAQPTGLTADGPQVAGIDEPSYPAEPEGYDDDAIPF